MFAPIPDGFRRVLRPASFGLSFRSSLASKPGMIPLAWALLLPFRPHDPPPDDRAYPFDLEAPRPPADGAHRIEQGRGHGRPHVTSVESLEDEGPEPDPRV